MVRRVLLIFGVLLLLGAPSSSAGAATQSRIPDLFSGSWPAKLMPSNEALGTITWISVSEEWGRGVLGQPFGGAPFTNCPPPGQTRFFLGRYGTGGKLIGCTIGVDGKILHGRYDGAGGEFRPGSFDVSIVTPDDLGTFREFFGVYVEDGGITTNWCGELIESSMPDTTPPSIAALPTLARAGRVIPLRFSASDDHGRVRVQLTVRRRSETIGSVSSALRTWSPEASLLWRPSRRVRARLRGIYTFCARAWDAYGNPSGPSCSTLRIH